MQNSKLELLELLSINTPKLKKWEADSVFTSLGLLDLTAPLLSVFPIKSMSSVRQFAFRSSFDEIPKYLCDCKKLRLMSFENYKSVEVDDCFKKKIRKGYYSDLVIYDGMNGMKKLAFLSKDKRKVD